MKHQMSNAKQANKQTSLTVFKCENCVRLLVDQMADIKNVQDWARKSGVSRRWFCKLSKEVYGISPKLILRKVRFEIIVRFIKKNPAAYADEVAGAAGLRNADSLYKFLSSYFDTNFTKLKKQLYLGKIHTKQKWLKKVMEYKRINAQM